MSSIEDSFRLTSRRTRVAAAAILLLAFALLSALVLAACGSDATNNKDFGQPPNANIFNPGLGGGSGGYGSGTGMASVPPPVCPDAYKACPHQFTYPLGTETSVELRGDFGGPDTWMKGVQMKRDATNWTATVDVPYNKAVQYKFYIDNATWKVDPAQPNSTDASNNTNNNFVGTTCDPADCNEPGALPAGVFDWRDAVIYFVFVDRFSDGSAANNCNVGGVSGPIANYQGGDWAGVTAKINSGYFTQLGANVLWLTVPVKNADTFAGAGTGGDSHMYSAYHGYWPSDPTQTESCFGTKQELVDLVAAAHTKNLKVIFDYAMVHVQMSSSVYTAHNDWFWPNSNGGKDCICGQGCDWNADAQRCWFTNYLPHWNYTNAAARDFSVASAVQLAVDTKVDGFRLDAIKHVDISWLTQLRAQVTSQIIPGLPKQSRFYMVGETYDFGNQAFIKSFVDPASKLDGQFDFPLRANVVNTLLLRNEKMSDLAAFMGGNDYFYGGDAVMSTFIGNHDLPRAIHLAQNAPLWGDQASDGKDRAWQNQPGLPSEKEAYERLANAFGLLLTNRGAPLIYYGDEIAMPGGGDPDNRRMMTFTGWTANQTYVHDRIAMLNAIRAAHPALRRGTRSNVSVDDDSWVFVRTTTGDNVWVAINRSDNDKPVSGLPAGALTELVTNTAATGPTATIPARQTRIFVQK